MKPLLAALALCLAPLAAGAAECVGENLFATLSEADRAEIRRAADAVPYHRGLFWQARKDGARITLIGTYHFDDPRHADTIARFAPLIAEADALLVELGPEEEVQLKTAMKTQPDLLIDATGPTLPEQMSAGDWAEVSAAMAERGLPAIMVSKMRPWYVATLLGISPCMMRQVAANGGETNGLDFQLMDLAEAGGVPVIALEPWDTALTIFAGLTPEEGIDMIRFGLPAAEHADDYATTLIETYFDEDVWTIWEFARIDAYHNSGLPREEVDRLTDEAQALLMDQRNRNWIAPLTGAADAAATRDKGIVAAFGALHLPGEAGILRLLEKDGWSIERLGQ